MLFPATCDVIRNLSGVWQLLYPKLYVRYLDLPQVAEPELAADFWREELAALARDLGEISGAPPTDAEPARGDRRLQRGAPARPRALPGAAGRAVERADRGALPAAARRRGRPAGGVRREGPATTSPPSRRSRAACATAPRHRRRRVLRAAAARADQDDRAGGLLHRGRRLPARQPDDRRRRAARRAIRSEPGRGVRPHDARNLDALRARSRRASGGCCASASPRARRRHHLRRGELLRPGAARPADAARRRRGGRASPASRSSTPRTPASSSSSASRPGRSPTRSSSGGAPDGETEKDRSMVLQKEMIAEHFRAARGGAGDAASRSSTRSCRATSPS